MTTDELVRQLRDTAAQIHATLDRLFENLSGEDPPEPEPEPDTPSAESLTTLVKRYWNDLETIAGWEYRQGPDTNGVYRAYFYTDSSIDNILRRYHRKPTTEPTQDNPPADEPESWRDHPIEWIGPLGNRIFKALYNRGINRVGDFANILLRNSATWHQPTTLTSRDVERIEALFVAYVAEHR